MYQIRNPWGKVVYQCKEFKKLLKKAYDMDENSQYSYYDVWIGNGPSLRQYDKRIAVIHMTEWGKGLYMTYAGNEYTIYANGSTNWHRGDPDPCGILDADLIARREKFKQRMKADVKVQYISSSPLDEIDKAFEKGKKDIRLR